MMGLATTWDIVITAWKNAEIFQHLGLGGDPWPLDLDRGMRRGTDERWILI